MAPTKWLIGQIIKLHPGQDGKVFVVTVRTAEGVYKRPFVKLLPLVKEENYKTFQFSAGGMLVPESGALKRSPFPPLIPVYV